MDPKETRPPTPEWPGMPPMMRQMIQGMAEGMNDFNPMAMCQAMMTSVSKSAEMSAFATPEVRTLFEEWVRSVAEEVLTALRAGAQMDLNQLAGQLKISPESALYFLSKLVREGKATISCIRAS